MSDKVEKTMYTLIKSAYTNVYRQRAPQSPTFPHAVCFISSATPTTPSTDYYFEVNVYDLPSSSAKAIRDIADSIADLLDCRVLIQDGLNIHSILEQQQYVSSTDLVDAQMINMRFVVRAYEIGG